MVAAVFAAFVHECDQGRPQDATDLRATQEGGARPDMERLHKTACFDANTAGFTIGSAEKRAPDREIKRHRKVRDHPETADEAAPKCGRLHFMRLRRHQWQLMAKRLKRLKQGIIIENRRRKWNESKIWRKMAKVLKAAARNDRFEGLRRLREEANAIALEYVNELLKDFGMNVERLEELPVRTSETENRRIPAFDSSDEVMEVFVNKALARYSLPMIAQEEEEEEEEEVAEKSASAESGESKSEPELASQSEDMTD